MQRYDAAFEHAVWVNQTLTTPQAKPLPDALKAAAHHMSGVILYHLKRPEDAKTLFAQAAAEGDKTAADWQKAIDAPPVPTKPDELAAAADQAAQSGKLPAALVLYVMALQQYEALGDKTAGVMERALAVALRMDGYLKEGSRTGIPIGVYRAGGTESPIYLDADFLLGPEAAHLNITGVSGLATKTSAVEWLLQSIFAHFPQGKGSVA